MPECPFFSLVKIGGTVSSLIVPDEGTDAKAALPAVRVTALEMIADLSPLTRMVRSCFAEHYRTISGKIALSGSHLKLPLHPDWMTAWIESERRVIYYMRCADPMYEAEIDVFADPAWNRIEKIVAWQRFKGE